MARPGRSIRSIVSFLTVVSVAALAPALTGCDKAERWGSPWAGSASGFPQQGATKAVEPGAAVPAASAAAHH